MHDKKFLLESVDDNDEIDLVSDDQSGNKLDINVIDQESIDIDEFFRRGGECGRYQIMVQFFLMLTLLPLVYPVMIFYYMGFDPPWKCVQSINGHHSERYSSVCNGANINKIFQHDNTDRCHLNRSEWEYDYSKKTLVTEFDLVCSHSWLNALTGSIVFVGWGIGMLISGFLSDRYGRKRVMLPCLLMTLIFLFLHAFVTQVWQLIVIRFLLGLLYAAPALNGYILVVEMVGPNYRTLVTSVFSFLRPVVALVMALKAMFIDNWRTLTIVCSAPYVPGLIFAFCIPESVRWLNMKGRTKEAEMILHKAARFNKKILPPLSLRPPEPAKKHEKKASYMDLFRRWKLAKSMMAQGFIWFECGMTLYALDWAFADLGGDMYVNFVLSLVVEMPASVVSWFLMQKIGRRRTGIVAFSGTALACLVVACIPKSNKYKVFRVVVGLTGKFMIANAFSVVYIWSSEIYPTVLRTQGMGINIVTSRIGAATSPFIKLLDHLHPSAPFILMTVCSVIATLVCLILPETLDDMIYNNKQSAEMRTIFSLRNEVVQLKDESSAKVEPISEEEEEEDEDENDPLLALTPDVQVVLSEHTQWETSS